MNKILNLNNKVNYDNYAKTFAKSRKNMKWPEIDFILNYVKEYIEKDSKKERLNILDLGCGSGRLIEYLDKYFGINKYNYIGIDYSFNMIEEAKKNSKNNKKFIVGDMCDFKIEKKQDLIILVASFHHLLDKYTQIKSLNNIKKYLKKDGIIAFINWNLNSKKNLIKYNSRECSLNKKLYLKGKGKLNNKGELNNKNIVNIKIGNNLRQYYSFDILELEGLFKSSGFNILYNKLGEKERNIISILSI